MSQARTIAMLCVYRRTGLLRFFLPRTAALCLLLALLLCGFAFPGEFAQARTHGFTLGFGTAYHSGGWPYYGGYRHHRGYWPRYHHHAWIGPLYPYHYYEQRHAVPNQNHVPADTERAHKPPLRQSYQDIAPALRSLFDPTPPATKNAAPPPAQATASLNAHEQHIVYPIRTRESREAWERAQRWYLGDVPRVLKR
jgi:hypothetical protein